MATTSTVPAAINALVALLKSTFTAGVVDVHDGPPVTGEALDYVCIGHDPADPLSAVEGTQVPASLGNRAREESYELICCLVAWSGDDDMAARRTRAMELFAQVEAAVRADITLSGAVRTAQVSSYTLIQERSREGTSAGLRFRIVCSARLNT